MLGWAEQGTGFVNLQYFGEIHLIQKHQVYPKWWHGLFIANYIVFVGDCILAVLLRELSMKETPAVFPGSHNPLAAKNILLASETARYAICHVVIMLAPSPQLSDHKLHIQ